MDDFAEIDMPPSLWKLYMGHGSRKTKTKEYSNWISSVSWQLHFQRKLIGKMKGEFSIHLKLSRIRKSCDLDNYIKPIMDILQSEGIIENDNKCVGILTEWHEKKDRVCMFKLKEGKINV